MSDTHTEVTTQSWGSRLKASIKGILIGLVLVAGSFLVLFKNEGRAVRRYKALNEGARDVISVNADQVVAANEGALVHLSGPANTAETLRDQDFGVAIQAIHLDRTVEMYQWLESSESRTEKKAGGATETTTTYSYRQGWSDRLVDSTRFHQPAGHANPSTMPYRSGRISATRVSLGAFRLGPGLIDSIREPTDLPFRSTDGLPAHLRSDARIHDNGIYLGANPASPRVGDLRVSFSYVAPQVVSVVARQSGSDLGPYTTHAGGTLELLRVGNVTAEEMFVAAREANKGLTWVLRFVGFMLMIFGLRLILAPFGVMADVLPFLGNLVSKGATLLACALALPLSLFTISVAWLWYRPLFGIAIMVMAAIALYGFVKLVRRRTRAGVVKVAGDRPEVELPPVPTSGE